MLLSAAPGYEFADWGGADHVGGGSHGSLHRSDSLGALVFAGVEPPADVPAPVVDPRRGRDGARRTSGYPRADDRRARRHRRRAPALPHADARGRPQARELARARPLRHRRRERLRRQPRRLLAARPRRPTSHYRLAATGAFVVAVANNFFWNRHWTFRARDGHAGFQAARFLAVSLVAFAFNLLVLELLVAGLEAPEVPAQAVAIVAATPLSFLGNKLWSFAR